MQSAARPVPTSLTLMPACSSASCLHAQSVEEAQNATRFAFDVESWPDALPDLTPTVMSAFFACAQLHDCLVTSSVGGLTVTKDSALRAAAAAGEPWMKQLLLEVPGYTLGRLQGRFPPDEHHFNMLQFALRGPPATEKHVRGASAPAWPFIFAPATPAFRLVACRRPSTRPTPAPPHLSPVCRRSTTTLARRRAPNASLGTGGCYPRH